MGITVGWGFMDILKEAKYHDVSGKKVLLLGRQNVYMSPLEVCCLAKKFGVEPIIRRWGKKPEGGVSGWKH